MLDFDAPYAVAQSTLTLFLFAMGVSQLFMGYLSDRFGRRPVMMAGLFLMGVGSLLAATSENLTILLISRLIQGVGGAAGISLSRAIVRDVYGREKSASVIGYLTMAMVVAPMLGPSLGGFIAEYLHWQFIFYFLMGLSMITLLLVFWLLNETAPRQIESEHKPGFIRSAAVLMKDKGFIFYTANMTFPGTLYYAFQAAAPFWVIEVMAVPPSHYGIYMIITALGYFFGNFFSGKLALSYGSDKLIKLSIYPVIIGIILFWALSSINHPLAAFLPMFFLTFSNGLAIPNAVAGAVSINPALAGTASGLSGFIQIMGGVLMTILTGHLVSQSVLSLLIVLTVMGAAAVFFATRLNHS